MSDIRIFIEANNSLNQKYLALLNKENLENNIKEIKIEEKIKAIEDLMLENNTNSDIILEYLKLKEQINDKDKDLNKLIEKYEDCIFAETYNSTFKDKKLTKLDFFSKLKLLFIEIIQIINENDEDSKLVKIINILNIKNEKFSQTFPIFYSINKELYFNSLYYIFLKSIKTNYKENKEKIEEIIKEGKNKKLINEFEQTKKKYVNKLDDLNKTNKNGINNKKIEDIKKIHDNIHICLAKNFIKYINNLSKFIDKIYETFFERYKETNIFITEKYDESQKNDIDLFSDFIFFLYSFKFESDSDLFFFLFIWEDTFKHTSFEKTQINLPNFIDIKKSGKNLSVGVCDEDFTIENIDNYFIQSLLWEICQKRCNLDIFQFNQFLRIDKYDSYLFIKKHWNKLTDYLIEILCSTTLESALSEIIPKYKEINDLKSLVKNILNNIRFFNFKTDFVGITKKRFLNIYIQAFPPENTNGNKIDKVKIIYLTIFLITCFDEIMAHLLVIIYNYLNKNNKIGSSLPNKPSDYAKKRKKESGEFLEELLFGDYKCSMTIAQILFILDKKNYSTNFIQFRNNFIKCDSIDVDNISSGLMEIMKLYEIDINELDYDSKSTYKVSKSKGEEREEFPHQHKKYSA